MSEVSRNRGNPAENIEKQREHLDVSLIYARRTLRVSRVRFPSTKAWCVGTFNASYAVSLIKHLSMSQPSTFPLPPLPAPSQKCCNDQKKIFVPQFPCSSQSNLKGEMNLSIIVSVTKTFFFFLLLSLFREEIAPLTIRVIERPEKASEASSRMRMCWWPGADERSDRCVVL